MPGASFYVWAFMFGRQLLRIDVMLLGCLRDAMRKCLPNLV